MTLVELIVVLAIIATMATVVSLTLHVASREGAPSDEQRLLSLVTAARERALRSGHPVHVTAALHASFVTTDSARQDAGQPIEIIALPDGRVVADPPTGVDQLTGRVEHSRGSHAP